MAQVVSGKLIKTLARQNSLKKLDKAIAQVAEEAIADELDLPCWTESAFAAMENSVKN
jgi:hypothetical protein